jgi:hypothetical protein
LKITRKDVVDMARQTIRTTNLLARGGEGANEVTTEVSDLPVSTPPIAPIVSTPMPPPPVPRRPLQSVVGRAFQAPPPPAETNAGQAVAGQQPIDGPANPNSAAAKGRAKRKTEAGASASHESTELTALPLALTQMLAALEPLDDMQQLRVLRAVTILLGFTDEP